MKKIIIVINHMNIGGIQKSLLELLKALAINSNYEVSLFCCKKEGELLDKIPNNIKIISENPYARISELPLSHCKKYGMRFYVGRLFFSLWSKCFTKEFPADVLCKKIGQFESYYDVAISYSQPIEDHLFCNLTNEIVLKCICAKRKITFVHCDFGSYGGNTKRNRDLYKKFDYIAAVSNSVKTRFEEIIPEVSDKVLTVYNFCDCDEIIQLANLDPIKYDQKSFVTVARLSEEKGILRCIPIFSELINNGFKCEWHIVGDGPLKNQIKQEIERYNMEQYIILEGKQLNPYRYIKNADYFFLPSYHEAAPMVFDEAITLGVPVLTTNTLSAIEFIESQNNGIVCENNSKAIYHMLERVLSDHISFNIISKSKNDICMNQFSRVC